MIEHLSKKYYIGKNIQKGYWASVYNYRPKNENILARKGEIFAVVRLKSSPDFDLITAGGIFLDYFHETYFEIQEASPVLALEKTVIASSKYFEKLISNDEKAGKTGIEIDLLAMTIVDTFAYFVKSGDAALKILREDKLVDLTTALKDPTGEKIVEVASMELQSGDKFFMATQALTKALKESMVKEILEDFTLASVVDMSKRDHEYAAMITGYQIKEKSEEPAVPMTVIAEGTDTEDSEEQEEQSESEQLNASEELPEQTEVEKPETVDSEGVAGNETHKIEEQEIAEEESVERAEKINDDFDQSMAAGDQVTYKVMLMKAVDKLKTIPGKLKTIVKERKPAGRVTVGKQSYPKNTLIVILAIVLLAGGLYLGVRKAIQSNQQKVEQEEAQVSLEALDTKLEQLDDMISELRLADSSEKRQQGLSEVQVAREELDKVKDFEQVKDQVQEYENRIQAAEDFFNRIVAVSDPKKLVDVVSFFPEAKISDMVLSGGKLYLTDSELGKIYMVNVDGSSLTELAGELTNPTSLSVDNTGKLIFLDEDATNRLAILNPADKSIKRLAGTSPSRLGNISAIEFTDIVGGRLYLIDRTGQKVLFMQRSGENYGLPGARFDLAELSSGRDLQIIDNKIYVLAQYKQGLYRFLDGQDDTPQFTGLAEGDNMLGATGLFVDGLNIYFADPAKQRVAVFDKGVEAARFKGQYLARSDNLFKNLQDLVVDSVGGKIYVVDNSVIYELDLGEIDATM